MDPSTEPHRSNTLPAPRASRPKFNSMLTSDRLRESCLYRPAPTPARRPRRSVFRETGLDDDASDASSASATPTSPRGEPFAVPSPDVKGSPV